MKVAIKNKKEIKYIDTKDIEVNGVTLEDLFLQQRHTEKLFAELLDTVKDHYIVRKDTEYIIEIDNKLREVDKLVLVEKQTLKYPLRFYEVIDGEIKLNRKKVVAL